MSFRLPPFLIKKIFPPKKSVSTVDTTGDGKADHIQIKAINVIQPFTIPENIDLGDFDVEDFDLTEYGRVLLDDEPIDISRDKVNLSVIKERIEVFHKGVRYTFDDIMSGKAGGKVIALGDTLTVLLKLDSNDLEKLTEGKHMLKMEIENMPSLEINFELTSKSMNVKPDVNTPVEPHKFPLE